MGIRAMVGSAELLNNLLAFGFLGGKEVKAAGVGNLGLHDRKPRTPDLESVHQPHLSL